MTPMETFCVVAGCILGFVLVGFIYFVITERMN